MGRKKKTYEEDEIITIDWIDDTDDENDVPEGCAACGGPYPSCRTACPMFDD